MKNLSKLTFFSLIDILLSVPVSANEMNKSRAGMGSAWDYTTYGVINSGGTLIGIQMVHAYVKSNG